MTQTTPDALFKPILVVSYGNRTWTATKMVNDQWSTANGQWSMTNDQWSMIDEKRTFATGQDPGNRITLDFDTVTWYFRA